MLAFERGIERAIERRHFHVINEGNGFALTIHGDVKPGGKIHVEKLRPDRADHQIWYLDVEGVLRTKLNDLVISGKDREQVRLHPYTGDAREQWIIQGNRIINRIFCDECLGLRKHLIRADTDVIAAPFEDKPHQRWRIDPVVIDVE